MAKNGRPAKKLTKLAVKRGDDSASRFGPKTSGNLGSKVSDGAGSRSQAGLPPETKAILPEKYELPKEARKMASSTMPVPGVNDSLVNVVEPWDLKRDRGL